MLILFTVYIDLFSFSSWVVFSCLFACLVIFDWMTDAVNFTLLGVRNFCIPINMLEFCSGMQLGHLEPVSF